MIDSIEIGNLLSADSNRGANSKYIGIVLTLGDNYSIYWIYQKTISYCHDHKDVLEMKRNYK